MTFAQLLAEFYASGFSYLDDNGAGAARAGRWVNQSYLELCAAERWPWLETTATGAAPLTITDLGQIESVVTASDKTSLVAVHRADVTDMDGDPTLTGSPRVYYTTADDVVNVYPANTGLITVRYCKVPVELSATTDIPVVPQTYHDVIVLGAVRRGLVDDQDAGDYQHVVSEYQARLGMMRSQYLFVPEAQVLRAGSEDW